MTARPPFAYYGGKQRLASWIVSLLPEHDAYIEPFAGSLAVLLAKLPAKLEVINDLDGDVANFWRVLRDQPDELEHAMWTTPHSRAEHTAALDRDGCDDLERARRWWIRITQSQGQHARSSGWRWAPSSGVSVPQYLAAYAARVGPAAARIRHVSLECDDAVTVIARHDRPGAVIYCDPPYVPAVVTENRYPTTMTEDQHRELAEVLTDCQATVLVSGYPSDLYDDLYDGWHVTSRKVLTSSASLAQGRALGREALSRTEVLWSNRPLGMQLRLDEEVGSA